MAIVFALELGHCRSRFLRAPRRQPDGAGNDPSLLVRPVRLVQDRRSGRAVWLYVCAWPVGPGPGSVPWPGLLPGGLPEL